MNDHQRNTAPMLAARRCGARTRAGSPCRAPAVAGCTRCRLHGATGGAPFGNSNRVTHGAFRAKAIQQRRREKQIMRSARKLIDDSK